VVSRRFPAWRPPAVDREGEGNHSTSVISRLGLVGGGGAVVMV